MNIDQIIQFLKDNYQYIIVGALFLFYLIWKWHISKVNRNVKAEERRLDRYDPIPNIIPGSQSTLDVLRDQKELADKYIKELLNISEETAKQYQELQTYYNQEIEKLNVKDKNYRLKYKIWYDMYVSMDNLIKEHERYGGVRKDERVRKNMRIS